MENANRLVEEEWQRVERAISFAVEWGEMHTDYTSLAGTNVRQFLINRLIGEGYLVSQPTHKGRIYIEWPIPKD